MNAKLFFAALLAVLALPRVTSCQDIDDALAEVGALQEEFEQIQQELMESYSPDLSAEEQEQLSAEYFKSIKETIRPRLMEALATIEPHAADARIVEPLAWMVTTDSGSEAAEQAMGLLLEHHLVDPQVLDVVERFQYAPMRWTIPALRKLTAAELDDESMLQAEFALAQALAVYARYPALIKPLPEKLQNTMRDRMGDEYMEQLMSVDSVAVEQEAIALYRSIAEKYRGQESFGRSIEGTAGAAIYEIQNLSVGKTAPEIEGEDIDGVAFKLSDYRGKVVMLDFWGDW